MAAALYNEIATRRSNSPWFGRNTPTAANYFYKMSLNYLEVPLIYTFRPVKYVSVHAGPTFGVLVGSKEEDNAGELTGQIPFQKTELPSQSPFFAVSEQTYIFRYHRIYDDGRIYDHQGTNSFGNTRFQ